MSWARRRKVHCGYSRSTSRVLRHPLLAPPQATLCLVDRPESSRRRHPPRRGHHSTALPKPGPTPARSPEHRRSPRAEVHAPAPRTHVPGAHVPGAKPLSATAVAGVRLEQVRGRPRMRFLGSLRDAGLRTSRCKSICVIPRRFSRLLTVPSPACLGRARHTGGVPTPPREWCAGTSAPSPDSPEHAGSSAAEQAPQR